MNRGRPAVGGVALLGVAVLATAGCGSRSAPLPPLRIVPATIGTVDAARLGERVYLEFTAPDQDSDGTTPGDIVRIEVYAVTTEPEARRPRPPVDEDWLAAATLVATLDVGPPGVAPSPATDGAPSADGVVVQGDAVTVVEQLTPDALAPVVIGDPDDEEEDDEERDETARRPPRPLVAPPPEPPPIRSYVAIAISSRDRMGDPSPVADVPLVAPPPPPSGLPVVTYTEEMIEVAWTEPPTFRHPVQPAVVEPPLLASTPVVEWPPGSDYAVYDHAAWDPDRARPEPLGPPGREASFTDPDVVFGETRCYAVRVIDYVDTTPVQGPASFTTCIELTDTFPPAAPTGLIAVADRNGISLVWDPNEEEDLAGYVVLRGSAPDATLQRLTTEPVAVAVYQDTRVTPGERYVYRIRGLDRAIPPNVSPLSEPVVETAR